MISPAPVWLAEPVNDVTRLSAVAFAQTTFDAARFCEKCAHIGYVFAEDLSEFPDGGWFRKQPCACNTDSVRDNAAMREAGVPDSFVSASLSTWNNTGRTPSEKRANDDAMRRVREIAARLGEASRDGVCVWLYGSQGAGKTWAACSLLREAILTWGFTGLFFQGTELVRASIDDAARFSSLYGVGWLVLDGIDRVPRTQTGYEKETLSALIKHRVQSRSPTVFTAHCPLKDIPGLVEGQCGAEIVSALRPVTVELALVGGNFSESKGVREKWSQ